MLDDLFPGSAPVGGLSVNDGNNFLTKQEVNLSYTVVSPLVIMLLIIRCNG
jgi:hypothetical protein